MRANRVEIESSRLSRLSLLLHPDLFQLDQPITVVVNGETLFQGLVEPDLYFRTLDALRVFDLFQIVLAQKRYSMASFTYYQLINNREMGYSSASSVVIFILIFVFAIMYIRMLGGVESE